MSDSVKFGLGLTFVVLGILMTAAAVVIPGSQFFILSIPGLVIELVGFAMVATSD